MLTRRSLLGILAAAPVAALARSAPPTLSSCDVCGKPITCWLPTTGAYKGQYAERFADGFTRHTRCAPYSLFEFLHEEDALDYANPQPWRYLTETITWTDHEVMTR